MSLIIDSLSKRFGNFAALNGASMTAPQGAFVALLGPSGSGKTTLLRILGGLEAADQGTVRFADMNWLDMPSRERKAGFVFQHYALFRHMNVAKNIAFGLEVRPRAQRPAKADIRRRVQELLAMMQLEGLGDRYPSQLSGGQRQRVALARALAIEPRMLLLDEPFGALDAQVRRELRRWLRELHDRAGVTTVFVTHDQEEALDLADRVAIMKDGELIQLGKPNEVYENPADPFVYGFLGPACQMSGTVHDGRLTVADWETEAPEGAPEGPVQVYFRPDEVAFAPADGAGLAADVKAIAARGPDVRIECVIEGRTVELEAHGPTLPPGVAPGLSLRIKPLRPRVYAGAA